MTFHLAAYVGSVSSSLQSVPPVTDMYLPSTTTGFLLPSPTKIVAAYATSAVDAVASPSGLGVARITAPSLLRLSYPYIRPVSHNFGEETDPNVMNLVTHPITLAASENVGIEAALGAGATSAPVCALLWFCDQLVPVPQGEAFALRFQASSVTTTMATWSAVGTINFDQSLPPGTYSVIGFEHWSSSAIAARLVFPGSHMRPGTLSMAGTAPFAANSNKRTERLFYEGGLGVYGTFNSFAPPSLEVLSGATGTNDHEGYLTVIRTGDAGAQPYMGSPAGGSPLVAPVQVR